MFLLANDVQKQLQLNCLLMALSGQSLRRNSLSAFGPKRTKLNFGLGRFVRL
jgi:hypothetical protein